jgi:nitrite reductase (NADH) small subunit
VSQPVYPDDWADACADGDIPDGGGVEVLNDYGDASIALFYRSGQYYALRNECPHQFVAIHDGHIEGGDVVCRHHGWKMRLTDGAYMATIGLCVETYDTRVVDGRVWVCKLPRPNLRRMSRM